MVGNLNACLSAFWWLLDSCLDAWVILHFLEQHFNTNMFKYSMTWYWNINISQLNIKNKNSAQASWTAGETFHACISVPGQLSSLRALPIHRNIKPAKQGQEEAKTLQISIQKNMYELCLVYTLYVYTVDTARIRRILDVSYLFHHVMVLLSLSMSLTSGIRPWEIGTLTGTPVEMIWAAQCKRYARAWAMGVSVCLSAFIGKTSWSF